VPPWRQNRGGHFWAIYLVNRCRLCGLVRRGHHFKIFTIHLCPLASRIAKSTAKTSPGSYPPGGQDHRGHFCRSSLFRWCPYGSQGCLGRSCSISMINLCPFGGQSRQGHCYKSSRVHLCPLGDQNRYGPAMTSLGSTVPSWPPEPPRAFLQHLLGQLCPPGWSHSPRARL
jgi:hypothetical protein